MKLTVMRQAHIGQWLGNIKQVIANGGVYFNLLNLIQTSLILYSTKWVQSNVLNLSFWQYMGLLAVSILCFLALVWKVDLPSTFSAWNNQVWKHENPERKLLEEMNERLKRLEEKK